MDARIYGKINLTLDITGSRMGMHTLSSVMASVSLYDEIHVEQDSEIHVSFSGLDGFNGDVSSIPNSNTAYKAARLVEKKTGARLNIRIDKGIPMAGGLGGSSADASAVLLIAQKLTGVDFYPFAIEIGSDVPFLMKGGFGLVEGTGENITALPYKPLDLAIINCGDVSTAEAYRKYDEMRIECKNNSSAMVNALKKGESIIPFVSNALFAPASVINPLIMETVGMFEKEGFCACMSGSGGCVYVLSPSPRVFELAEKKGLACFTARTVERAIEYR